MRNNYIIFNGKSSEDIKGLIIQELPSISRPKVRTENVVIDGRDGDIVTELGYQSYDKSMSIGLNMEADLDEVMQYFSGKGKVIFSNEPDKEYTVILSDKIDYNRLVKFRTANVKFHVQPYKYLVDEAPFIFDITNETEVKVANQGYIDSKPVITIWGTGTVTLTVNSVDICTLTFGENDTYLTVDSLQEDCYKDLTLKNRQMTGQFPKLKQGINTITWTGSISKIKVEPKSRWL